MKRFPISFLWIAGSFLAIGSFFLVVSTSFQNLWKPEESPSVRAAREKATLADISRSTETASFWTSFVSVAAIVIFLALLVAFAVVVYLVVSHHQHRRAMERAELLLARERVEPDQNGNYPALARGGQVVSFAPGNFSQPVPKSLHYSPVYHGGQSQPATVASGPTAPALLRATPATVADSEPTPAKIPTFADLLSAGDIDLSGNSIFIGYKADSGDALRGTWKDLYSTGIAGLSGSGKSNTTRFILAQSILVGSRLIVVDPHGLSDSEDSLVEGLKPIKSRYLFEPACKQTDMLEAFAQAHTMVIDRVEGRSTDRTPIVLVVDELMNIMRREGLAEIAEKTLQAISQEGRKVRVYAMAISQQWKHDQISTSTRDSFASFLIHRSRRNSVQKILSSEELRQVEKLPAGTCFFYSTKGEQQELHIPLTTEGDLAKLAEKWERSGLNSGSVVAAQPQIAREEARPQLAATEVAVVAAFRSGKSVTDIVKEVYNAPGGNKFVEASREVQNILRKALA